MLGNLSRRQLGSLALAGVGFPALALRAAPRVVFLNPGEATEKGTGPFWRWTAQNMQRCAQALGIELEVLFAERDMARMLDQAEVLAARTRQPDYVLIVNERGHAPRMLELFDRSSAQIVLIHSELTQAQRQKAGGERGRHANWIGTFVADNGKAQCRMMDELASHLAPAEALVVGLMGDPDTAVAVERAGGIQQSLDKAGRGRILQNVSAFWTYAEGQSKTEVLLRRYPQMNAIWAANDSMALGALKAVRAANADVCIGGAGGWPEALESIAAGGLHATGEGHSLIGVLALLEVFDHHNGIDFVERNGNARRRLDYLNLVTRNTLDAQRRRLFRAETSLNYTAATRSFNPSLNPASRLEALLT